MADPKCWLGMSRAVRVRLIWRDASDGQRLDVALPMFHRWPKPISQAVEAAVYSFPSNTRQLFGYYHSPRMHTSAPFSLLSSPVQAAETRRASTSAATAR